MTASVQHNDDALVLAIAAVWKHYFDQQSAMLASAMRPWEASAGPSRQWEPYREAAAIVMAKLLARLAEVPFARLYRSALADADLNGVSPRRRTGTSSGRAKEGRGANRHEHAG